MKSFMEKSEKNNILNLKQQFSVSSFPRTSPVRFFLSVRQNAINVFAVSCFSFVLPRFPRTRTPLLLICQCSSLPLPFHPVLLPWSHSSVPEFTSTSLLTFGTVLPSCQCTSSCVFEIILLPLLTDPLNCSLDVLLNSISFFIKS